MFSVTRTFVTLALPEDMPLIAYLDFELDCSLIVRGFRIVRNRSGLSLKVPTRKRQTTCPQCERKNPLKCFFCGYCGKSLPAPASDEVLYVETAKPITPICRRVLEEAAFPAYKAELKRPRPRYAKRADFDEREEAWTEFLMQRHQA